MAAVAELNNQKGLTTMCNGQIRQGDILLVPVDQPAPHGVKPTAQAILALGEITGHAHRLGGAVLDWTVGANRYVRILGDEPGTLQHEDHDPEAAAVVEPEQTYQVIPQREWSLEGQWRKVVD